MVLKAFLGLFGPTLSSLRMFGLKDEARVRDERYILHTEIHFETSSPVLPHLHCHIVFDRSLSVYFHYSISKTAYIILQCPV